MTQEQIDTLSQSQIFAAGMRAVEDGDTDTAELCLENLWKVNLSEDLEDAITCGAKQ